MDKIGVKEAKELVNQIIETNNYKESKKIISEFSSDSRKAINALADRLKKAEIKYNDEIIRVKKLYEFDKAFGCKYVLGVDEVGRGPLAGPIVACGVILDLNVLDDELILGLNDSKKINEKNREIIAQKIREKALAYYIATSSDEEIDEKGIAYANNKVFLECSNNIKIRPEIVLSDGYKVKGITMRNESVIKGDTKSACIAAASIVAKVYRDNLMKEYAKKYPEYGFDENAGYGTQKHINAIKENGTTPIHRKCFLKNILGEDK